MRGAEPWRLLALSTPLEDLHGDSVTVLPRQGNKIMGLTITAVGGGVSVKGGEIDAMTAKVDATAFPTETLGGFMERELNLPAQAAMVVPELNMPHRPKGTPTLSRPWRLAAFMPAATALYFLFGQEPGWWLFASIAAVLAVLIWWAPARRNTVGLSVPVGDGLHLSPAELRKALSSGTPPPGVLLPPKRVDPALGDEARASVAGVKEEYGALLSDIAYRIESSALFDVAVPLTKEFHLALAAWDDEEGSAGPKRLAELAREVELTFTTAKDQADTMGLRHLPDASRADGELAAKAARLAQSAPSEGERLAASRQAARLLRDLALYYLPGPEDFGRELTHPGGPAS